MTLEHTVKSYDEELKRLQQEIASMGFAIIERARHGSGRRDARVFIVARKPQ